MESGNIILFPKWQKTLEEESIAAIKDRQFEKGLEKLDMLLSYQVKNQEIYTGKLICLMELERYEEAQELCESLLMERNENYYHYIHIYLTLLFQTNQYGLLIDIVLVELESGKVPESLVDPFKQLYEMSEKMRLDIEVDKSNIYLDSLFDAVHQDNHIEQSRLINKLRNFNMEPNEKIISLLVNEHVHPLNKSAIYIWLQEKEIAKPIDIHKFGVHIKLIPLETPKMKDSNIAQKVHARINEIEQKNPTLFQLMETLLGHYLYILYPITPPEADVEWIAKALIVVAKEYLNVFSTETANDEGKLLQYMKEIKTSDALYLSIIEE